MLSAGRLYSIISQTKLQSAHIRTCSSTENVLFIWSEGDNTKNISGNIWNPMILYNEIQNDRLIGLRDLRNVKRIMYIRFNIPEFLLNI